MTTLMILSAIITGAITGAILFSFLNREPQREAFIDLTTTALGVTALYLVSILFLSL